MCIFRYMLCDVYFICVGKKKKLRCFVLFRKCPTRRWHSTTVSEMSSAALSLISRLIMEHYFYADINVWLLLKMANKLNHDLTFVCVSLVSLHR